MNRDHLFPLDGEWLLDGAPIQVPFPPEAPASGYTAPVKTHLLYEKRFTLPEGFAHLADRLIPTIDIDVMPFAKEHVFLHIGAVDQLAYVFLNGVPVTRHEGGYLPFKANVTFLLKEGENLLQIQAIDDLLHRYPYGKQCQKPHGMWYTPVSGIWKSVWLEVVPNTSIDQVRVLPRLDAVEVTVTGGMPAGQLSVYLDGALVTQKVYTSGETCVVPIPDAQPWTPDHPALYQLEVLSGRDRVTQSFGLRTVGIQPDAKGIPRLMLNDRPIFLQGVLDQGYYPGGWFRPENGVSGYEEDIRRMQALGFNTLRMHIKVEDEAFYDACDRLGMMVLQDMPQSGHYSYLFDTVLPNFGFKRRPDWLPGSKDRRAFFEQHCRDVQSHLYNHPCVIGYTIFNEGWGQYDTSRIYHMLKEQDPSRVYISSSGWFKGYDTDLDSDHIYFRNRTLKPSGQRPLLLSECGGYVRRIPGHMPPVRKEYGYGDTDSEEALTGQIRKLYQEMVQPAISKGLCGVIYTQLTDVENELNGLYTFDRAVCKVNEAAMRQLTQETEALFQRCL